MQARALRNVKLISRYRQIIIGRRRNNLQSLYTLINSDLYIFESGFWPVLGKLLGKFRMNFIRNLNWLGCSRIKMSEIYFHARKTMNSESLHKERVFFRPTKEPRSGRDIFRHSFSLSFSFSLSGWPFDGKAKRNRNFSYMLHEFSREYCHRQSAVDRGHWSGSWK